MNIGIDVGGSHIGIGLVNEIGKIEKRQETYILEKDPEKIKLFVEQFIIHTLKSWKEDDGISITKIGIAMPGSIVDGKIKYSFNFGVEDYDLTSVISGEFPDCEIHMINDAKCAALAEKNIGVLREYDDAVFMCLGTGIGGAAFYDGKLVSPRRNPGFEYGHMIIKKDGEPCKCGSSGCFERYGSMRAFKSKMKKVLNLDESLNGEELKNIVESHIEDEVVQNTIDLYIDDLCVGISNIINILEPQAICIGGGFADYKEILFEKLVTRLNNCNYIFNKNEIPKLMTAELGNDAGIIGSALFI